ncbi:MAG: phenylalanine--tRNA ligase subunit beta, partial [Chloroflexi bacterium]|nr:phenylalanine--tRNA ligase subunit beta [Chloroflexota bacterium]
VLELKPDRGDCLCIEGLAREVAALAPDRLTLPPSLERCSAEATDDALRPGRAPLDVRIEAKNECRRYVACVLEGVRVGPSPDWLRRRILQLGLRPVNNVVDVTAYVMMEIGQPMHAFDLDRLMGPEIVVRLAAAGEKMTAIDGMEYTLADSDLVIADRLRPVGVAGVMGGQETEVTDSTTRVLLESAWFQPVSVRLTSRSLGLSTDASQRFERAVDPSGCMRAARRAASLIQEVAGGSLTGGFTDLYPEPAPERAITLRPARVNKLLGMSLSSAQIRTAMERLGLAVEERGSELEVRVPPRRPDLAIEEDLVEEVIRIIGYDTVPNTLPVAHDTPGGITPERRMADSVRDTLVNVGFTEIRSYSLTSPEALARAAENSETAAVRNPMSSDRLVLRPSILP